jgi:hypothetical protein
MKCKVYPDRKLLPMSTAPQDGTVVLSYWNCRYVWIAWLVDAPLEESSFQGQLFPRHVVSVRQVTGWRVLALGQDKQLQVCAHIPPFLPSGWTPLSCAARNNHSEKPQGTPRKGMML